jgi:hypothetical protein
VQACVTTVLVNEGVIWTGVCVWVLDLDVWAARYVCIIVVWFPKSWNMDNGMLSHVCFMHI